MMTTSAEAVRMETELAIYRAGWRRKTIHAVAEEIRRLRAVASIEFERSFDTAEEETAYYLGVQDVQKELRGETSL
jgi:hypothetical protein